MVVYTSMVCNLWTKVIDICPAFGLYIGEMCYLWCRGQDLNLRSTTHWDLIPAPLTTRVPLLGNWAKDPVYFTMAKMNHWLLSTAVGLSVRDSMGHHDLVESSWKRVVQWRNNCCC